MMDAQSVEWAIGISVTVLTLVFGADVKIHTDNARGRRDLHARCERAEQKLEAVQRENFQYQINAAQQFATVTSLNALKAEFNRGIERLSDKLDQLIVRNNEKDRTT